MNKSVKKISLSISCVATGILTQNNRYTASM